MQPKSLLWSFKKDQCERRHSIAIDAKVEKVLKSIEKIVKSQEGLIADR